jgi:hypothetical protein
MTRIARACALLALALFTALALAGPATAKKKPPHKHGKGAEAAKTLPKKWSKRHKARGAKADPDDDGLSNWGEFRSRTKPKKADSDKDGIGDAEEDYDRDGLDNGSEIDAGTDPGRKDTDRDGTRDGAEDADGDGLTNAAEDRTGNHPRKADSDGDGIADGDENAGTVQSFDGTTLTIALAAGGTLTATLDELTEVGCDDELLYDAEDEYLDEDEGELGDDEELDEEWDEGDDVEELSIKARLAEEGDEDDWDDEEWDEDELGDCTADIEPGTPVREAEVEDGVFVVLELLL